MKTGIIIRNNNLFTLLITNRPSDRRSNSNFLRMKKILLSLAAVAMTLSASAQTTMSYDVTKVPTNAQIVTDVTDITVTYGGEKSVDKTGAPIAASSANEEGDVWKNALKKKGFKYTIDGNTYSFSNYAEAVDNARGATFAFDANAPVYGGFVKYEPVTDGQIVAYFYIPDNKAVVVTEINKNNEAKNLVTSGDAKIYIEDGTNVTVSETGIPDAAYKKTVGVIVWDVKGGNTYYLMLNGSKIGVGGFIFASTGKTSDPEPAQGETFEVQGNGATLWDKTFDSVTIPFEFNKETKVATFTNFLGSNASFTIKFEITDPNRDPDALDSTFNSVAVSGLGEGEANGGHTIDGFTDPIILNQDNAPFGKLENALFWTGYNTQMKVETADINGTTVIVYAMKFMLGGGDYYPWDAATSTWGEKAATSQYEFINLIKKIPVNAGGDESGIEDIVTDNVDENAPVEYYNLQGIRLSDPAAGQIVIRRQGSKVSKILVR